MTLRHLRIFIHVYQYSSITQAAQALHIAQPSISLAIKEIESYYQIQLFDRIGRRIFVTEAAKKFYEYASHILTLYDQMEKDIFNYQDTVLHIGCVISIGQYLLIPIVKEFKKKYPNVQVNTVVNNLETIEQMVVDNTLDFALIAGNIQKNTSLVKETFYNHSLCFIVHPTHPLANQKEVTLTQISQYDLLLREKGSATRNFIDSLFLSNNIVTNTVLESVSTSVLVEAVKENLGISCVPYAFVEKEIEKGKLQSLNIPNCNLDSPFSIIYHHNKYLSMIAKDFIALCKKYQN